MHLFPELNRMKICHLAVRAFIVFALLAFTTSCGRKPANAGTSAAPPAHEHKSPHGGTAVVLGEETYHIELVLDASTGTLQAFVLDGEMETFIRTAASDLVIETTINGKPETLELKATANSATGEVVGDTALFETRADWLKTTREFDGTLKTITIRGTTFTDVKFNFPKGNEHD